MTFFDGEIELPGGSGKDPIKITWQESAVKALFPLIKRLPAHLASIELLLKKFPIISASVFFVGSSGLAFVIQARINARKRAEKKKKEEEEKKKNSIENVAEVPQPQVSDAEKSVENTIDQLNAQTGQ